MLAACGLLLLPATWSCGAGDTREEHADDHGNTLNGATPVSPNSATPGVLEREDDVDSFWFTVPVDGRLTVETSGGTDTVGRLFERPEEEWRPRDDDNSGAGTNFRFDVEVTAGDYFVNVSAYRGTGPYRLEVSFREAPAEAEDDHGDVRGEATVVASTSTTPGYLESADDVDWFRFRVPNRGRLVVETAGDTDTVGRLYRPNGGTVLENDDSTDSAGSIDGNFGFEVDAESGDYHVSVRAYEQPGPYDLLISLSPCSGGAFSGSRSVGLDAGYACSYFGEALPSTVFTFGSDREAESIIEDILQVQGLPKNFDVRAGGVPNAVARIECNRRMIIYNQRFIRELRERTGNDWAPVSVMAHEIGHHLSGHTLGAAGSRPPTELEADRFSGFALQRLGASLEDAQAAMEAMGRETASNTHPAKHNRLAAIASGWYSACDQDVACGGDRAAPPRPSSSSSSPSTPPPDGGGGTFTEPVRIRDVRPVYPPLARQLRVQGAVVLQAVIDPAGFVTDVEVVRSVAMLDDAAIKAVREWRYDPARSNGNPVHYTTTVTVNFTLQ